MISSRVVDFKFKVVSDKNAQLQFANAMLKISKWSLFAPDVNWHSKPTFLQVTSNSELK